MGQRETVGNRGVVSMEVMTGLTCSREIIGY